MAKPDLEALNGKVALITGATDAIGRELSLQLAGAGCRIGLADESLAGLQQLHETLQSAGAMSAYREADLTDRAAVSGAVQQLAGELGPANLVIHNVDRFRASDGDIPDPAEVREMLEWNCLAGIYCVEAILPAMLARGSGHIVTLSSLFGVWGGRWGAGYAAATSAWSTYLESLRPALRGRGIVVTTVHSGFLRTPPDGSRDIRPFWRMPGPDRVARRVLKAIRTDQREVYFPKGQSFAARFLRMLPAPAFDACTRRFEHLMLEQGTDTSLAELSRS